VRAPLCKSTYHTMEISKDSQFLEICKEPNSNGIFLQCAEAVINRIIIKT